MSIGRDEVLHVARLAELAVRGRGARSAGGAAQPHRGLRRPARPGAGRRRRPSRSCPGRRRSRCARTCRARCRSPAAGGDGAGVRRRLLPGAAPRRDGGPVSRGGRRPGDRRAAGRGGRDGLNATLHWSQDAARCRGARGSTRCRRPGRCARMPIALKDNIVTIEAPTTCGSRILEGYVSPYNATAVERLRAAGAMMAAKANMDEFAMGSSTEHSAFGRVQASARPDPRARRIVGGSAALVAAGVVPAALGLGDRRLGAPAGELLRRGGREAELRPGEPLRPRGVRLLARLHLGVRPHRGRRRAGLRAR